MSIKKEKNSGIEKKRNSLFDFLFVDVVPFEFPAHEFVEPRQVREIVRHRFHVVEVVLARAGHDLERDEHGEREGELVPAVRLDADPDVEDLKAEVGERVHLHHLRDDGRGRAHED